MRQPPTVPAALAVAGDSEMFWISHVSDSKQLSASDALPHND
jgi:hypothetical protein